MSHRREACDSDSKRHRSKPDRQSPSPKRSRRGDEKPHTHRVATRTRNSDAAHDDTHRHQRLQQDDSLPRCDPVLERDNKLEDARQKSTHQLPPRSNTYFQHDERGSAAQVDRTSSRQPTNERGWRRDPNDRHHESTVNRGGRNDAQQKDEKSQAWRHDGFFQMEADPPLQSLPPRRRPAFSEKKMSSDPDNDKKAATEERGRHDRQFDSHRPERTFAEDRRPSYRAEAPRGGHTREGYGGGNYRENEKSSARQGYFRSGDRVNKWKHDLFDEANRSPTRKNEEDQIAKAEALLLSL